MQQRNEENLHQNSLNEPLLSRLLQQNVKGFHKITNWRNSQSFSYSIRIEIQSEDGKLRTGQYVLKAYPTEKLIISDTLSKEFYVYTELIPDFEKLYGKVFKEVQFAQTVQSITQGLNEKSIAGCILLEDALSKGYRNASSAEGLDVKHIEFALKKLAAFHAASAVYVSKHHDAVCRKLFHINNFARNNGNCIIKECDVLLNRKFIEGLRFYDMREYQDKIRSFTKSLDRQKQLCITGDVNEFNVLLHGNCWPNNFLYSYDAFGKIKEVLLTNFTNCEWGSPAIDLLALLLSASCLSIKISKFDYFVKVYHDELCLNLKILAYNKNSPKLTDLHLAISKYYWWGFEVIQKILPTVMLSFGVSEFHINEKLIRNHELNTQFINEAYANPRYAKEIAVILPWMENRGFLEE
ncbi:uncharacterized protein LOC105208407 isoform X1 [Zeugodacus cucurbitae]|uniref:uncharacterized protein LOC105208407 isoform X1 n=1 Tax=Zeugodacus cucurbitae TaxID=28588 RepID=UPI0005968938|nr:uncharacterized protein LOC105208407 isoform X1 [Zeugodacus cucurbitae]